MVAPREVDAEPPCSGRLSWPSAQPRPVSCRAAETEDDLQLTAIALLIAVADWVWVDGALLLGSEAWLRLLGKATARLRRVGH